MIIQMNSSFARLAEHTVAAEELVFLGLIPLAPEPSFESYQRWINAGKQAGMGYMARYADKRADPSRFGFNSCISFALRYGRGDRLRTKIP